jgi:hypothetical protein
MAGLGDFARRIRAIGKQVETGANRVKRQVALVADRELVLETPVDTGRARSNWIVSLQAPVLSEREPYAPGQKLGRGERANAQAAIDQGAGRIVVAAPGQTIFISNNVRYIGRLNDGWSAQAPAGFVQGAVMRAVSSVRGARILRGN